MTGFARIVLGGTLALLTAAASPASPAGKVEERALGARRLWVYTPPGYDAAARTPYDLLLVFDGEEYLEEIPLPKILDSLLAGGKAPPFVAVLIDNASGAQRLADLANRGSFADYLERRAAPVRAEELERDARPAPHGGDGIERRRPRRGVRGVPAPGALRRRALPERGVLARAPRRPTIRPTSG